MSRHVNSYSHSNTAHVESGGWSNWGQNSYSRSNWNDCCYYEGGCWYWCWHGNSNSYSRGYSNYGNHSQTNAHNNTYLSSNSVNVSPSVGGAINPNSGNATGTNITVNINSISYSDPEGDGWSSWRLYASGPSYSNIQLLTEQSASNKTYNWNIGALAGGNYYLYVTVYDGITWSALPSGSSWTAHYIEAGNTIVNSYYNSPINYYKSGVITVIKYTTPTWIDNTYFTDEEYAQVHDEVVKARSAFGLGSYSFSNTITVGNFQKITATDMNQVRTAANEIYVKQKGSNYPFTTSPGVGTTAKKADINDVKKLLEALTK